MALARSCRALFTKFRVSVFVQPSLRQQLHQFSTEETDFSDADIPELHSFEEEEQGADAEDNKETSFKRGISKSPKRSSEFSDHTTSYKPSLRQQLHQFSTEETDVSDADIPELLSFEEEEQGADAEDYKEKSFKRRISKSPKKSSEFSDDTTSYKVRGAEDYNEPSFKDGEQSSKKPESFDDTNIYKVRDAEDYNGTHSEDGDQSSKKSEFFDDYTTLYKGILFGTVLDKPLEKFFKNGFNVVVFTLMTGGRVNIVQKSNNERLTVRGLMQRHRICVFKRELVAIAKKLKPGSNVYIEGNIETQEFDHPMTRKATHIRELCVRENGNIFIADEDGFVKVPLSLQAAKPRRRWHRGVLYTEKMW